ncbi:MAG: MerR family transcriptional regulator [Phascolarctobacterium sp.]|nr:MerR family transcriptional regulator [Phascolarctobacterium sp.]
MNKINSEICLDHCFTAGELANLFGISKQTLLYYDRIKLLSPDFIGENGYRHYSINQYLDLEIIVNLRSLNIPIADIKEYLEHRSKQEFYAQLEKKKSECAQIIKENERIMRSIDNIEENLRTHNNLPLEQITVCWREERLLRLSEVLSSDAGKKRIAKFARHSQMVFHNRGFVTKQAGWIVSQENFFTKNDFNRSKSFFSFSEHLKGHYKVPRTPLPTGLYLELYFQGTYSGNALKLQEKITSFMERNDFVPCSDVYVLPIENHWLYDDINDYINLIFLQVKNK